MSSFLFFFFFLICFAASPSYLHAIDPPPPPPRGYHIQCGATDRQTLNGIEWIPDDGFISVGNSTKLTTPGMLPALSSVRYFPDTSARKYCYTIPVARGAKYLIRTTYFYGGFDGGDEPPVFDQIVSGTRWSSVNTSESYAKGLSSYYEIVVVAKGKSMSVCLARSQETKGNPFVNTVEIEFLEDSMYSPVNFTAYGLATIARHNFGSDGQLVSYPDDPFNRYWAPFTDKNFPVTDSHSNITSSDFYNIPPQKAFQQAITTSRGKELVIQWPLLPLPSASYYLALYFQDNRTPSPFSWRVFDVSVNGELFYKGLNVSTNGVMVYGTDRPLSGLMTIKLTPDASSKVGPVINAGELFQVVPLNGRTLTRDVIVMEDLARSLDNRPSDWSGDPCLPKQNSWSGVICSEGQAARIIALNLTNYGLFGSLPKSLNNLTAISSIWLGGNKLSGPIPDMSSLTNLAYLHLEDNQLTGSLPASLGLLPSLKELFLQNNKLDGELPDSLKNRKGIIIKMGS